MITRPPLKVAAAITGIALALVFVSACTSKHLDVTTPAAQASTMDPPNWPTGTHQPTNMDRKNYLGALHGLGINGNDMALLTTGNMVCGYAYGGASYQTLVNATAQEYPSLTADQDNTLVSAALVFLCTQLTAWPPGTPRD